MAETKKKDTVTIKLPRPASKEESSCQFVGVNGKSYLIRKGVEVEVPAEVAEVIALSEKAKDEMYVSRQEHIYE